MDGIAEIRRRHLVSKESISSIARDLKLLPPTVRKRCRARHEPRDQRRQRPTPVLGAFHETQGAWLAIERALPKAQRRTARRLFEGCKARDIAAPMLAALRAPLESGQSSRKRADKVETFGCCLRATIQR